MEKAKEHALRLESQRDQLSQSLPEDARYPEAMRQTLAELEQHIAQLEKAWESAQQALSTSQTQLARAEEQLRGRTSGSSVASSRFSRLTPSGSPRCRLAPLLMRRNIRPPN